jgi:CRISPR type IV-associated protein Csf2
MSRIINTTGADFLIDVTTVTPMLQIEPTDSKNKDTLTKASKVITKKRKYVTENGNVVDVPFFSANGYRGILRRNLASAIFGEIEKKDGGKFGLNSIHLYASGGGTSNDGIKGLNYVDKINLREDNPFISCFGAGLSDIDGKLSVSDITPLNKDARHIGHQFAVRFDESLRSSVLSPLLDAESVEKHAEEMLKLKAATKSLQKLEEKLSKLKKELSENPDDADLIEEINQLEIDIVAEKEAKNMSYQQTYKAEYILPNTKMSSSIGTRAGYELTELERAMMLFGLIQTSQQSIGSYSRIGWGTNKWEVKNSEGETLFRTVPNGKYVLQKETEITELGKAMLKPFEEWLENVTRESIFLMD